MEGFTITIGRENIDHRLLMLTDPSLARVMGELNMCTCFAGMLGGKNVAACLLNEQAGNGVCDIMNFSVANEYDGSGLGRELLFYVMDYARSRGFRFLETGTGNAKLETHRMLQKTGFRVIGVFPDYYQSDGQSLAVENGIVNRDMVRYRVDFLDGWVTWTKEVKYI